MKLADVAKAVKELQDWRDSATETLAGLSSSVRAMELQVHQVNTVLKRLTPVPLENIIAGLAAEDADTAQAAVDLEGLGLKQIGTLELHPLHQVLTEQMRPVPTEKVVDTPAAPAVKFGDGFVNGKTEESLLTPGSVKFDEPLAVRGPNASITVDGTIIPILRGDENKYLFRNVPHRSLLDRERSEEIVDELEIGRSDLSDIEREVMTAVGAALAPWFSRLLSLAFHPDVDRQTREELILNTRGMARLVGLEQVQ